MGIGDSLNTLSDGLSNVTNLIKENPLAAAGAAVGTAAVVGGGIAAISASRKKRRSRSGRARDRRFKSKQKHEQRYKRKRKYRKYKSKKWHRDTRMRGSRKIYYARKTGQPYIILPSGRAKFIKGKRRK